MGATVDETPSTATSAGDRLPLVNRNLISLKAVLFIVYGGLGCLYSTLIPHMLELGLSHSESRTILIVAPLVSLIGPLAVAPLADRLAAKKQSLSGKYLRVLIAITLLLAACVYAALLAVPSVSRSAAPRPLVSFGCDADGAIIYQERCSNERTCYHQAEKKTGSLVLTNCTYTCQHPTHFERLFTHTPSELVLETAPDASTESLSHEHDYEEYEVFSEAAPASASLESSASSKLRQRRETDVPAAPPHLCEVSHLADGTTRVDRCHAFNPSRREVTVQATLRSATNEENQTHSAEWCTYPLDGFQCQVPQTDVEWMRLWKNDKACKPMVECEVQEPYDTPGSVLADSQCVKVTHISYICGILFTIE